MHYRTSFPLLSLLLLVSSVLATSSDTAVSNANHIFNAIHSSMRQWGGSLNHNGMSLFLATVPEGTQLYHGTSDPDFVKGMQWLAFEPEHALIFARPRGGPGGPPSGEGKGPPGRSSSDGKENIVDGMLHDGEGWKHDGPPREHGHDPSSHHDESHDRFDSRPPHDKNREHHRPPPSHKKEPCNGTERLPPPPNHPDRPRKGGPHHEHGPPPPLPPGHIYKPYPPPPRKDRSYKGPRRPWSPEHRGSPPSDHHSDAPKRSSPPPPNQRPHNDHLKPIELHSTTKSTLSQKRQSAQHPLQEPQPNLGQPVVGYLHTYKPTRPLHLLYIDGLSAGKTANGTLDTQDLLLLNLTSSDPDNSPMGGEMARAKGLCDLASTIWEDRIDGVLRLEGGFEIILCAFEKHLERVDVISVPSAGEGRRGRGVMGGWEYVKAITSRYHGIGGGRVRVDYEEFVSVFAEGVDGLWENDVQSDVRMPRLTNVATSDLERVRDRVTSLVLSKDWTQERGTNWQAVADVVVARYSDPLHHITTHKAFQGDKVELAGYLQGLLRPFIDGIERNATRETERCVGQLLLPLPSLNIPPASLTPLAHRALHTVTTRICDTLLTSLSIATSPTPHSSFSTVYAEHAVEIVAELVEWLNWTSWKECGACGDEEVCFVPIWPMGTAEDHAKPQCRGEKGAEGRMGYWGLRRGGPPRDTKPPANDSGRR